MSNTQTKLAALVGLALLMQGCGMRSTLLEEGAGALGDPSDDESGDGDGDGDGDAAEEETLPPCGVGIKPCDLSDFNGATCETLGYAGGDLYCDPVTCLYDTAMCAGGEDTGGGATGGGGGGGIGGGQFGGGGGQNPFGGGGGQNPFGGGGGQNPFGGGGGQNPFGGGQFGGGGQ